jgi:hypothetical protein
MLVHCNKKQCIDYWEFQVLFDLITPSVSTEADLPVRTGLSLSVLPVIIRFHFNEKGRFTISVWLLRSCRYGIERIPPRGAPYEVEVTSWLPPSGGNRSSNFIRSVNPTRLSNSKCGCIVRCFVYISTGCIGRAQWSWRFSAPRQPLVRFTHRIWMYSLLPFILNNLLNCEIL